MVAVEHTPTGIHRHMHAVVWIEHRVQQLFVSPTFCHSILLAALDEVLEINTLKISDRRIRLNRSRGVPFSFPTP